MLKFVRRMRNSSKQSLEDVINIEKSALVLSKPQNGEELYEIQNSLY